MDTTQKEAELEEGEISDLEDGEIEDDETPGNLAKTPLISEPPQKVLQGCDFHHSDNTNTGSFRGGKINYFNPQRPIPPWRRDAGPLPRFVEEEIRFREQESPRMRTRPSFLPHNLGNVNSPRQVNVPWKKNVPRISPNLPSQLTPPIHGRKKPFTQPQRLSSPSPDTDNTNDYDLLLKRHKEIQLQLDLLEKEGSAAMLDNEDFIDDSFVDIPVDKDINNINKGDKMGENIGQADSGEMTSKTHDEDEEQDLPKSFEPFKIKPLHPPVPTLKELSNRKQEKELGETLDGLGSIHIGNESRNVDGNQESQIISPVSNTIETSQTSVQVTAKKMKRRRRRKRQKDMRKVNIVNKGNSVNNSRKDFIVDVARTIEENTVDCRLMQLAASSTMNTAEMEKKMRTSAEQQKKRRERLKQWQQSHNQDPKSDPRLGKGRGSILEKYTSPGARPMSDGKDFEKDDYLEAPMDVESDTPDGPVLPLIEETGDDTPPPPPPPPARDQELMALMQQQQNLMAFNTYSVQNMLHQAHVSPNIHGFYPPGQIIYNDWPGSYTSSPMNRETFAKGIPASLGQEGDLSPPQQKHNKDGQTTPTPAKTEEEDDDEAALLREILLKSVAKKRAAKSTDLKEMKSQSAPASPKTTTSISESPKPTLSDRKIINTSHANQKPVQQPNPIKKVPIQPPQHDPVVIRLGEDSDSSDEDVYQQQSSTQQRGGFFGSLDMMLKQARNSVENSKPKPESKSESTGMTAGPKTPDALAHLPEERRAEYKRLKEQLAQHEGRKTRQPLSDISQDKESKSESESVEEKIDSAEESRELLELKEKVKTNEEKLAKHRKSLSEDQEMLGKMTSMLSEKTILLEVQETRVSKLKKQLETAQKAMLNNRLVIKKLHEKAIKVKDRVAKKMTVTRNIEEDLLRVKSMVSAVRRDPSFYTGSDSNENKDTVRTAPETKAGGSRTEGSLKRSLDDSSIMNIKKAKIESPKSQSAKASPRKSLLAERIAQEKARLKRVEQDLAERLSHFMKSPSKSQPIKTNKPVGSLTKQQPKPEESTASPKMDEKAPDEATQSTDPAVVQDSATPMDVTETNRKENERIEFNIDDKQLDYIKKLQVEKEKTGPTFPKSTHETPQPVYKRTASCIWLETNHTTLPVLDVNPTNLDWLGSSSKSKETDDAEEMEEQEVNKSVPVGLYESVLLYFRSYRLSPYYRTKAGLSLSSLTFTNKLNPFKSLCDYELKGACNDEDCKHQHCCDYTPTDTDAIRDLASYSIQASEKLPQSVKERRINLIVEKFTKQYKGKIPLDQLLVLLVNSIKKDGKKTTPFNISGSVRSVARPQHQPATDDEESSTVDRGRGVQFRRKDERKIKRNAEESRIECQEIRYFSEVYDNIKTLTDAVEESPSDIALWIKLSRLQLHQTHDDNGEGQDMGLMQCLNTLSRGLEANPNSQELWLEYLKLFRLQGHQDEHKELCEQAIGFTPTYDIWWHYLDSVNTYDGKRTICLRLLNHLVKQEQEQIDGLHSHRILESLLYLIQLELYTGRRKLALLAFQSAIGKKKTMSNDENTIPKLTTKISAQDLCLAWLAYIHVLEFHRLPATWFDPKYGHPTRMIAKDSFVFPWQPGSGTHTPSEKILGMFHEALRACTLRNKATSNKVALCLPLYQNLLALERAHGRLDSAKGICRRLLQSTPGQMELWQCLAALEEATGNPKQGLVVLSEGLKKCGYNWELAYTTARLQLEQGEASKAIETLVYTIKSRCLDPSRTKESPKSLAATDSSTDPILLYRKLLSLPIPYDSKPPPLMGGVEQKPTGRDELYLWLSYCLLLELSPSISPLCLQYNLSAESAYETAVHTLINRNNAQAIWLEYLFYKMSRVTPPTTSSKSDSLKPLDDLVNRCLVSVSASRTLPYSTSESWMDYSFHNQVINLYLGCLPQSLWSAVYTKYLKLYPSNLQLAIRACEHEASTGCVDQAVKIASIFLAEHPSSITMWKILISLNLQRNHTKEAHKLYQQSTDVLPFAATLWKDFIMFEIVRNDDKSSMNEIIKKCKTIGVDVEEYLKTLQGK